MRLIYVDEAGTAPAEPVRVVAGVVVEADEQWRPVADDMKSLIAKCVPKKYQDGFVFHGKEVFNGGKNIDRSVWQFSDRLDFFKTMLGLLGAYEIPISVGVVWRGSFDHTDLVKKKTPMFQIEHSIAFSYCIERADVFLRKYLVGREVGTVIAEAVPVGQNILSSVGLIYRDQSLLMTEEHQRPETWEVALGINPEPVKIEIKHIIDVVHFVDKKRAPMLQLADACAFAFRRSLSKQPHGDDLVLAMLGEAQGRSFCDDPVWLSMSSSKLFNTRSYWSDEQKAKARQIETALAMQNLMQQVSSALDD